MGEKEKLEKEIRDARNKLEDLEDKEKEGTRSLAIKNLDEYSDEEKIEFFDTFYGNALSELEELEKNGYSDEDNPHYVWETYIQILAKNYDGFWFYWNSLGN